MARGRGDAWARDAAERLAKLPGPVWVAFHHEPEGDGNMAAWTQMQERLGPIVRRHAKNVGFSIIMTGWNTLYSSDRSERLKNVYPNVKVDVLGIDAYDTYKVTRDGRTMTEHTDMAHKYFAPIAKFAKAHNTHWGIAETGYTHAAAADQPNWLRQTVSALQRHGGVGISYFNSSLHSVADWRLTTSLKKRDYRMALDQGYAFKPRS
ncbi:hypothetical protein ASG90_13080 [Nocardioides sp. Soil797]|nr:hypothetical protein ASG90_13080 [Nocardioides sp. Soil797]